MLALALLASGLHLGEPAHAGENGLRHQLAHGSHMPDTGDDESRPADAAHASHHHCPVAPDAALGPVLPAPMKAAGTLHGSTSASLASFSRAPPLQPPST